MGKFSYIICYRHQEDRHINLLKVVGYLSKMFGDNIEIILVEQDIESKLKDTTIFDKYIFTYSDRAFNRSWAFNVGTKLCTHDKIFYGDCDLIVPKNQINRAIRLLDDYGCVSPYKRVIDLTAYESLTVGKDKWANITRDSRPGINLTGGVVGFKRSSFYEISGWCEDFEGWGGEDDFQTWKVNKWLKSTEVSGNAYHLYHPRPQINRSLYVDNLNVLRKVKTMEFDDLSKWIKDSCDNIGNPNRYGESVIKENKRKIGDMSNKVDDNGKEKPMGHPRLRRKREQKAKYWKQKSKQKNNITNTYNPTASTRGATDNSPSKMDMLYKLFDSRRSVENIIDHKPNIPDVFFNDNSFKEMYKKYHSLNELIKKLDSNLIINEENVYIKNNVNTNIKYIDGSNNFDKVLTFIMPIKGRSERAFYSIESIVNEVNSKYIDFIIVEDKSDDLVKIPQKYENLIEHHLVETGDSWSRTKLLNYGIKRSKTPLCAMWDTDFIFPDNFIEELVNTLNNVDITNQYFAIPSFETHKTVIRRRVYDKGESYGNFWIYPREYILKVGGFNEKMVNWGFEERELEFKFGELTDIELVYTYPMNDALRVYHYSHSDSLRGKSGRDNARYVKELNMNDKWGELDCLSISGGSRNDVEPELTHIKYPNPGNRKKTLIVMGNGPSLRDVDFELLKNYDTFGLNAAYRKYDELNFYPTYFGCFDYVVTDSHRDNYQRIIEDSPIDRFFFIRPYFKGSKFQYCNLRGNYKNTTLSDSFNEFQDQGNSGANACQVGILLGYEKIILLGVDQNYIERVDGSKVNNTGRLTMDKTPDKNPNYWFDDYQQKGDVYNHPQLGTFQKQGWELFAEKAKERGIDIVNCSPITTQTCFRRGNLEEELGIVKSQVDKYSERDMTFIIPFRGSEIRAKTIIRNLEYLTNAFRESSFFIAEHSHIPSLDLSRFKNVRIRYDWIRCDEEIPFDRTGTLNYLIKHSKGKILINNDSDVFLKRESYLKGLALLNSGYDVVIPYCGIGWNVHHDFSFGEKLDTKLNYRKWSSAIGGVVMIPRDTYIEAGMENQNIISWGFEDFERLWRFKNMGYNMCIPWDHKWVNKEFKDHLLYHYDHDKDRGIDSNMNPHKEINEKIANEIKNMSKEELLTHISGWEWVKDVNKKRKILIYTDSRGSRIKTQTHSHYLSRVIREYKDHDVEFYKCPEKWTTTMDFLRVLSEKDLSDYDWIILQTSVVENSPRNKDDAYTKIYLDPQKKEWFDKVFGKENMEEHFETDFGDQNLYDGQRTTNMFSIEMGVEYLVPVLERIPNLIWITNNPLVGGNGMEWRGNYWRDRPKNIGIVNDYSKEYIKHMKNTYIIDNTDWSNEEIKKYTIDNIHYTKEGSDLIFESIKKITDSK